MPLTPEARDLVARTILGETGGQDQASMAAVANVIKNRLNSGAWGPSDRLGPVIKTRGQFASYGSGNYGETVSASDPAYQRAAAIADQVFGDQAADNTGGATHFYANKGPNAIAAPSWAAGQQGQQFGDQIFFKLPLTASNTASTAVTGPSSVGQGQGAAPPPIGGGSERPQYQHGVGTIGGMQFHWGSGEPGQYWSIPYGDYPVTPNAPTGVWAHQAGAIPIANNVIPDPLLGRNRVGIMIHSGSSPDLDTLYTEGCFKVAPQEWPAVRQEILAEAQKGPLYLHVAPGGVAAFTNTPTFSPAGGQTPAANANVVANTTAAASSAIAPPANVPPVVAEANKQGGTPAQPAASAIAGVPPVVAEANKSGALAQPAAAPQPQPAASSGLPDPNAKFQVLQTMGQGGRPGLPYTALNLTPGAGSTPAAAPALAAPATPPAATPDLTQRVPLNQPPPPPPPPRPTPSAIGAYPDSTNYPTGLGLTPPTQTSSMPQPFQTSLSNPVQAFLSRLFQTG